MNQKVNVMSIPNIEKSNMSEKPGGAFIFLITLIALSVISVVLRLLGII